MKLLSILRTSISLFFILLLVTVNGYALPAFPTAEGFGSETVGGRGGVIIHVTNLNDAGAGSFREAVTTPGARTVVFDVSGNIELQTQLQITEPYLTIAGQTSPGGICIAGEQVTVGAHDVIIRHMRFRMGQASVDDPPNDPNEHDSFDIWGSCAGGSMDGYNVVVDHCSLSWGADETSTFTYGAHDITVQWSMFYEGLKTDANHSKGLAMSNKLCPDGQPGVYNISGHHNFFASNYDRNPYIAGGNETPGLIDWRNNVAYNWYGANNISIQGDRRLNAVHNLSVAGPESNPQEGSWPITQVPSDTRVCFNDECKIYVLGNLGGQRVSQDMDEWCVADWFNSDLISTDEQSLVEYPAVPITITPMDWDPDSNTSVVGSEIVSKTGATKPIRDDADVSIISDFENHAGTIPTWKAFPDDYPPLSQDGDNPLDTDQDGMLDAWEIENGTDPNTANNNDHTFDAEYTDIEYYINTLAGDYEGEPPQPPAEGCPLGGNSQFQTGGNSQIIMFQSTLH